MTSPSDHPWGTAGWEATSAVLLSVSLFLAILRLGFYDGEVRWDTILALSAFALLTVLSACGGGSSSTTTPSSNNTTGATGNTSAVLTGTASSGSPVSSMNFTVTIQ